MVCFQFSLLRVVRLLFLDYNLVPVPQGLLSLFLNFGIVFIHLKYIGAGKVSLPKHSTAQGRTCF